MTYLSKTLLNDRIQEILHGYEMEMEDKLYRVSLEDGALMKEIFYFHPQASEKLRDVEGIAVGHFTSKKQSKCFYVIKKDGSFDDISYVKSVENLYDQLFRKKHIEETDENKEVYAEVIRLIAQVDLVFKVRTPSLTFLAALGQAGRAGGRLVPAQEQDRPAAQDLRHQHPQALRADPRHPAQGRPPHLPEVLLLSFILRLLTIDSEIRTDHAPKVVLRAPQFRPSDHKDEMLKKLD